MKNLQNPSSTIKVAAKITGECKELSSNKLDCEEGQKSAIVITNNDNSDFFSYMLDLSPSGGVTSLVGGGDPVYAQAGKTFSAEGLTWGTPFGTNVIKLIVTRQQIDSRSLLAGSGRTSIPLASNDWTTVDFEVSVHAR